MLQRGAGVLTVDDGEAGPTGRAPPPWLRWPELPGSRLRSPATPRTARRADRRSGSAAGRSSLDLLGQERAQALAREAETRSHRLDRSPHDLSGLGDGIANV